MEPTHFSQCLAAGPPRAWCQGHPPLHCSVWHGGTRHMWQFRERPLWFPLGHHPGQQVRICIDLWHSSPPWPHSLPQASCALVFHADSPFYSNSDPPSCPHGFPQTCGTGQNTSFWIICSSLCWPFQNYTLLSSSHSSLQLRRKHRQVLQAGSSGLLPALEQASVFALVTGHRKHLITLWLLHSMWAWWRAGLLWALGLSSVSGAHSRPSFHVWYMGE